MKENNSVFIALGTNLGDRGKNIETALSIINKFIRFKKLSSIYETQPVGYEDQGWFLNMVIHGTTNLSAENLLKKLKETENGMGRKKRIRKGPRIIDLDILFYSDSIICFDGLIIPHPEIQNRNFVLTPLNEIAPDYIHPGLKKDVRTLLKNLNTDKQVKIYDKSIKTVILIDNYDSFTYNLYQQLESLGADTKVVAHDKISIKNINSLMPSKIVISPGPGKPEDSGISRDVIESFYKKVPILGVCLGHECIGEIFGAKVVHAKKILHGKTSEIRHNNSGIFKGLKNPFEAARYNSLVIDQTPEDFILTAWDPDNEIMGISHKRYPLHGIQFHPESFMTKYGHKLIRNFLNEN